jgi:hypothetical protein
VLSDDEPLRIEPASPAWILAAAIPLGAVALVLIGASRGALDRTTGDPVPPSWVAVLTIVVALFFGWRAATQTATLDANGLVSRNLTSTVRLDWALVEELRAVRRPGLVMIEIRLHGTRRRLRLGPATRWEGAAATAVMSALAAQPQAGALLVAHES